MKFIKNLSIVLIFCFSFLVSLNLAYGANFIIAIDDSSRIYYAKSNGDGTFSDYGIIDYLGGNYARGVTINDFNNDGHMDFIAGRGISSTAYLYLFLNDISDRLPHSAYQLNYQPRHLDGSLHTGYPLYGPCGRKQLSCSPRKSG